MRRFLAVLAIAFLASGCASNGTLGTAQPNASAEASSTSQAPSADASATVNTSPKPAPPASQAPAYPLVRTVTLTVVCQSGLELVDVYVEPTGAQDGPATWGESESTAEAHFTYTLPTASTPYSVHAGCGRKSSDQNSKDYDEWLYEDWSGNTTGTGHTFLCADPPAGQRYGACLVQ